MPVIKSPVEWVDAPQPIGALENVDLESRSTLSNCYVLFWICALFLIIHLSLKWILKGFKETEDMGKCKKFCNWLRNRLLELIVYAMYARLFLEAHQTLLFSSLGEIREFDTSSFAFVISNIIAIVVLLICIFLFVAAWYYFIKHFKKFDPEEKFMLMEIYADLKNNSWARIYTPLAMTRRTLIVFALIVFPEMGRDAVFIWMFVIQVSYLVIFTIVRPFEKAYMNLLEMVNEGYFVVLISMFFFLDSDDKWTDSRTSTVLTILTSNTMVVLAIMMSYAVFAVGMAIYTKCCKKRPSENSQE